MGGHRNHKNILPSSVKEAATLTLSALAYNLKIYYKKEQSRN